MKIVESQSGGVVTLAVEGRLDATSSSGFETRILEHIAAGNSRVIVDLTHLDYINSVGLRVFMLAAQRLKPTGGRLVLCALRPSIQHVFEIAGFSTVFAIAATREEAATLVAS